MSKSNRMMIRWVVVVSPAVIFGVLADRESVMSYLLGTAWAWLMCYRGEVD